MKLQELRKTRKITQKQLADQLGVKSNTVSAWETGRNPIPENHLESIARILKVHVDEIDAPSAAELDNSPHRLSMQKKVGKLYDSINTLSAVMDDCIAETDTQDLYNAVTDIIDKLIGFTDKAAAYASKQDRVSALETGKALQQARISFLTYQADIYENLYNHFEDDTLENYDSDIIRDKIEWEISECVRALHDTMLRLLEARKPPQPPAEEHPE